jgi:hypothetical protein
MAIAAAVAVSNNPKLTAYEHTAASVWRLEDDGLAWSMCWVAEQMHAISMGAAVVA